MLATGENPHGWSCPSDSALRAAYGCDEAAEVPWFIACPTCEGAGCAYCGGSGQLLFRRCPRHLFEGHEGEVLNLYMLLRAHKMWPAAGGLDDQAAWFVDAVAFLDRERAQYDERERKRAEARSKARAGVGSR